MIAVQRSRCQSGASPLQLARLEQSEDRSSDSVLEAAQRLRPALAAGALACDFVDPSLAFAALDTRPERIARDVETLGLLFESLVVRVLCIDAQALDTSVVRDTDNSGLEADAVGGHGPRVDRAQWRPRADAA